MNKIAFLIVVCLISRSAVAQTSWLIDFDERPALVFSEMLLFGDATLVETGGARHPENSGYLSLTSAEQNQSGAVIFPAFDNHLSNILLNIDLRIGGGSELPGEGMSVSLVRSTDPILQAVSFANRDQNPESITPHFLDSTEIDFPEEGTQTGISVGFDEWHSGPVNPNSEANECDDPRFDCVGISVRIDGELVAREPLPTLNGSLLDETSIQTGSGTLDELGWARLEIFSIPNGWQSRLPQTIGVRYKDRDIYLGEHDLLTSPTQVVLAARTGEGNAYHHVDQVSVPMLDLVVPPFIDLDENGAIDIADFQIMAANMNTTVGNMGDEGLFDGDVDFNGRIDIADFTRFREDWFEYGPGSVRPVPEPCPLQMLAVASVCLLLQRRTVRKFTRWHDPLVSVC